MGLFNYKRIQTLVLSGTISPKNLVSTQEMRIFDQHIGFYVEFYVYIQILRSVSLHGGRHIKNFPNEIVELQGYIGPLKRGVCKAKKKLLKTYIKPYRAPQRDM